MHTRQLSAAQEGVPLRFLNVALLPVAALFLAACGTAPATTSTGGGGGTPTSSVPSASMTAEQVVKALAAKIPTAKLVKTYTAADDPNSMLGRPNGYTSKSMFTDSQIPADKLTFVPAEDVGRGGSVEVFPDAAGAKTRADYLTALGKSPMFAEYDYQAGPILVRVSSKLTPDQAASYQAALKAITG